MKLEFLDLWDLLLAEMEKTKPNMETVRNIVARMNKELKHDN